MTAESASRVPASGSSPNDVLEATSFLFGTNAGFVEALYEQYRKDPQSVDGTWRAFFEALGEKSDSGAKPVRQSWSNGGARELTELEAALTGASPAAPAKAAAKPAAADALAP